MTLASFPRRSHDLLAPFRQDGHFQGLVAEQNTMSEIPHPAWLDYERHDSKRRCMLRAMLASSVEAMSSEFTNPDLKPDDLAWMAQGLEARGRTDEARRLRTLAAKD